MLQSLRNIFSNNNIQNKENGNKEIDILTGLMIEAANTDGIISEDEIKKISSSDLDLDLKLLDPNKKYLEEIKLSLRPERKKGIILEGSDEEKAKQLVKIIREEERII